MEAGQSGRQGERFRFQLRRGLVRAKPTAAGSRAGEPGVGDPARYAQLRIEAEDTAELAAKGQPIHHAASTGIPDSGELALGDFRQHRGEAQSQAGGYELIFEKADRLPLAKSADQPGSKVRSPRRRP